MDVSIPRVMGILNVTSDSFYVDSRINDKDSLKAKVTEMIEEGVDIIDVGGCSTRPGFIPVSEEEELLRVSEACEIIRNIDTEIPLSIDTFRANVAKKCIDDWEADIINDITGGADPLMWEIVSEYKKAYILTHNRNSTDSQKYDDVTAEVVSELSKRVSELHRLCVNDVIIDPGFGFAKNLEQNFRLFDELNEIARIGLPVLVGISRKSMIWKTLEISPEEALTGTVALNSWALDKGANILRVHDVKEAKQTVKLYMKLKESAHD